jgi:hypothetical protein
MTVGKVNDPKYSQCVLRGLLCMVGGTDRCIPCFNGHLKCEYCEYLSHFFWFSVVLMMI